MVIIGVTDEEPAVVADWVKRRKPGHPVAILKDKTFEEALGVKFFPTMGVIDTEGNLVYAGRRGGERDHVGSSAGRSARGALWPAKVLQKPLDLARKGDDLKAYVETMKLESKAKDDFETQWLGKMRGYFEGRAANALSQAKKLVDAGRMGVAVERLKPYAKAKPAYPSSEASAAYLEELADLPNYKAELRGSKKFEEALAAAKGGEYTDAVEMYVSIYKKYDGTRVAQAARDKANDYVERGLPGMRRACAHCRKAERACDKHAEKVKL